MSLQPQKLAPTRARSVPSIVLKATTPTGKLVSIGAIKAMERRITREMTRRRELDSDPPGVTIELIPGAVTTFELSIERAMLYKSNMLEAFGFNGVEDLIVQNIPFEIHEIRNNLDGTSQTVVYKGCYFADNPVTIDVDREWVIMQRATIHVATCIVTGSKQKQDVGPDNFTATSSETNPPSLSF